MLFEPNVPKTVPETPCITFPIAPCLNVSRSCASDTVVVNVTAAALSYSSELSARTTVCLIVTRSLSALPPPPPKA